MTINELMRARWSVRGPRRVVDGETAHWEIRVDELPDFFVAAESPDEALDEYLPALKAFLESYLEAGEQPTLPPAPKTWIPRAVRRAVPTNQGAFSVTMEVNRTEADGYCLQ